MPANTSRLALPYPIPDDTVDVPRDVQALATKLDGLNGISPPVVTALPGAPVDGQECYFVADAPNGVTWHLKYRAAGGSYKWEYVGGGPLYANTTTQEVLAQGAAAYVDLPAGPGPNLTVPLAGVYEVLVQCLGWKNGGAIPGNVGCQAAGFAATVSASGYVISAYNATVVRTGSLTLPVAGTIVKMLYLRNANQAMTYRDRSMFVRPIRVA